MADDNQSTESEKYIEQIDEQLLGSEGNKQNKQLSATQAKVFSTIARVRDVLAADGIQDSVADSTNLMKVLSSEDDKQQRNADDGSNNDPSFSEKLDVATKGLSEKTNVESLLAGEEVRIKDYEVYTQIADYIVQVMEAAETYSDNILSPDSFNSTGLPVTISNSQINNNELRKRIYDRVKFINTKYDLHSKIENSIKKSIYLGDYFVVSFNLTRRTNELLAENKTVDDIGEPQKVTENDVSSVINDIVKDNRTINEDYDILSEFNTDEEKEEFSLSNLSESVSTLLNEVCLISEDSREIVNQLKRKESIYNNDIASKVAKRKGLQANEKIKLNKNLGSLVKEYHPRDVIKITDGNIVFGYLLVDYYNDTFAANRTATDNNKNNIYRKMVDSFSGSDKDNAMAVNKKYLDIISKTIVKKVKLNPKIIEDNSDLADIFYEAIKRSKSKNQRFTVTFAYPNEVHHFKPTNDIYGTSVLSKVKFFAKLYIGVLTNAFMSNAIRKNERLAYYIDVAGNDDDTFNSVNDLIRTIKQREVKFNNLDSISTVLNTAGEFHDFFIPTANGNRSVDIEPISLGQPKDIDNQFLEFLKKNIITGIGVPASFMGNLEDVDFARSLTMENGRFLRRVIRLQGIYDVPSTSLIREVYENEFYTTNNFSSYKEKDKQEKKIAKNNKSKGNKEEISEEEQLSQVSPSVISIEFPTPVTLSIRVQEEQLQSAVSQAESIAEIEVIDRDNELLRNEFKRLFVRKLIPSIDWSEIDSLKVEADRNLARAKGASDGEEESDGSSSSSGGFGSRW